MSQIVDARGLACPQPYINTLKALEMHDTVMTIVDNMIAVENLRRMASSKKCIITEEKKTDGIYITLVKPSGTTHAPGPSDAAMDIPSSNPSKRVLVITQDVMGNGDDNLGKILIKSFFHTIAETSPAPDTIIFFNTGVRLVAEGSEVIEDIKAIEKTGTRILSCGTCLDYFKIKDSIGAGSITNMYEIKDLLIGNAAITTI